MTKAHLPQHVNPFRFAENAVTLHGTVLIKNMPRLLESLAEDEGEVNVELAFGIDDQEVHFIQGRIEGELALTCQRCMEPFKYGIMANFLFGVVETEEAAAKLPESYDPAVTEEGLLNLRDLIEEELIVSLPIVPMHIAKECQVLLPLEVGRTDETEMKKENPFKVIESLRSKPK